VVKTNKRTVPEKTLLFHVFKQAVKDAIGRDEGARYKAWQWLKEWDTVPFGAAWVVSMVLDISLVEAHNAKHKILSAIHTARKARRIKEKSRPRPVSIPQREDMALYLARQDKLTTRLLADLSGTSQVTAYNTVKRLLNLGKITKIGVIVHGRGRLSVFGINRLAQ